MVSKNFWLGILVMVLVFGTTVVGCDNNSTDDSASWPNNLKGTKWTNNPTSISGKTLEFKTDNSCYIDGDSFSLVSADNNGKIVVEYRDENETLCDAYSISGNTLTFTSPSNKLLASETTWTKVAADDDKTDPDVNKIEEAFANMLQANIIVSGSDVTVVKAITKGNL
jgi:hypothetical protein